MATEKEKKFPVSELFRRFNYNPDTGEITWRHDFLDSHRKKTQQGGLPAFTTAERKGYLTANVCRVNLKAHRVAWLLHYGDWPEDQVDHINKDKRDNRINNLRVLSNIENCQNRGKYIRNTSGWTGVTFFKRLGRWAAKYRNNGKDTHVGYYNCPTAAGIAVMKSRIKAGFSPNHGFNT